MMVDRARVIQSFNDYASGYDSSDEKIRLKIVHTFKVASFCEKIARSIPLDSDECDLAWFIGMMHDIGRFEQVRRYGSFFDTESVDHAEFGADLLFRDGLVARFADTCDPVVEVAIRMHNKLAVGPGLSAREEMFCNIVRDADKIDILRVNVDSPASEIYNCTPEAVREAAISPEVEAVFYQHRCVPRKLRTTEADLVVSHSCLCYELVYPFSTEEVLRQGYVFQLLSFPTDNPETAEKLEAMKAHMRDYLYGTLSDETGR